MRIDVVAAIIRKEGQILITQRLDHVHLARLWEFPGGKVEPGETLEFALRREIREEIGLGIRVDDEFFTIDHDYSNKPIRLHFFNCTVLKGKAQPLEVGALLWVNPQDLCNYQFPPADAELIAKLCGSS